MSPPQLFDQEHERAEGASAGPWDWIDGSLALAPRPEPESAPGLKAQATFVTVPRMATPEAQGLPYRAARREELRNRARRARRTAALAIVACVCLVTLLLTAFGTGGAASPAAAPDRLDAGHPSHPDADQSEPRHGDRVSRHGDGGPRAQARRQPGERGHRRPHCQPPLRPGR